MSESYRCPQCAAEVPADAPQGLCPNCMLKAAFGTQPTGSVPPGESESPSIRLQGASFATPLPAELAPYFPDLEILELVGRGGMGVVYKARQKRLDRLVALKILAPRIGQDPAFAERFVREARAMAMLNHPHIVAVYDFGQARVGGEGSGGWGLGTGGEGRGARGGSSNLPSPCGRGETQDPSPLAPSPSSPIAPSPAPSPQSPASRPLFYFLMEFVDGVNLRRLLDAGKLAPNEALAIVPQICEALQYAHDHGVVHRDIKPENLLLDKEGQLKIADFGIAKLVGRMGAGDEGRGTGSTRETTSTASRAAGGRESRQDSPPIPQLTAAGQIMGTLQYMAPEQFVDPKTVDHRADIYSLGVVFYQMLTGELPQGRFAPPSKKVLIDVRLDEVVLRALEQEPERRYQQVSEIKTRVETIVTTTPRATGSARAGAVSLPELTGESQHNTGIASGTPASSTPARNTPTGSAPERPSVSNVLPKSSLCCFSTPKHLRSLRGRFLHLFRGKGELRLDSESLSFHSDLPAVVVPLGSICRIARGDYPYTVKVIPLNYIEVTYVEYGAEHTLLFTPVDGSMIWAPEANENVADWLSAITEAVRTATGRSLSVERSHAANDKFWTVKSLVTLLVLFTAANSLVIILLARRLPTLVEFMLGPINWAAITVVTLVALWDRRRRAIVAARREGLLGERPKQAMGSADRSDFAIGSSSSATGSARVEAPSPPERKGVSSHDASTSNATPRTTVTFDAPKRPWWCLRSHEVFSHMTMAERSAFQRRGFWFAIWHAATLFSPMAIAFFTPIPVPLNWIIAATVLMVGLAFYPLWWKEQATFMCSTKWARERRLDPSSFPMFPYGHAFMMLYGAGVLFTTGIVWLVVRAGSASIPGYTGVSPHDADTMAQSRFPTFDAVFWGPAVGATIMALMLAAGFLIRYRRIGDAGRIGTSSVDEHRPMQDAARTYSRSQKWLRRWRGLLVVGLIIAGVIFWQATVFYRQDESPLTLTWHSTERLLQQRLPKQVEKSSVWHELEKRMKAGSLSQNDVEDAVKIFISQPAAKRPRGWYGSSEFLTAAAHAGMISEPVLLNLCDAICGPAPMIQLPRLREGKGILDMEIVYGSSSAVSHISSLGVARLWQVERALLDGKPIEPERCCEMWDGLWSCSYPGMWSAGNHEITVDVQCAYVAEHKLIGLQTKNVPADRWPEAYKRWKQSVKATLRVYKADEPLVALVTDPDRAPGKTGGIQIERLVVQANGTGQKKVVLKVRFAPETSHSILTSYDVAIVIKGRPNPVSLGPLWRIRREGSITGNGDQLEKGIEGLDSSIRRADIVLTPNPVHVERFSDVSEIWGETITLRDIPIERLDLEVEAAKR